MNNESMYISLLTRPHRGTKVGADNQLKSVFLSQELDTRNLRLFFRLGLIWDLKIAI